ncbi:MAG: DUF1365 family protein [Pirellulales bacterium]
MMSAVPQATCFYEGTVRHTRGGPQARTFTYRLFFTFLDLSEVPTLLKHFGLWSQRALAPARFRRDDYFGNAQTTARRDRT